MNKILLALLAVLLASCGTTQYQQYPNIDAAKTDTAVLHVVRTNSLWGAAIPAPVYVDKYLLGRIGPGGYIRTKVPAGNFSVSSTTSDVVINGKTGEEYFVEVSMPFQIWFFTPNFDVRIISKQEAEQITKVQ